MSYPDRHVDKQSEHTIHSQTAELNLIQFLILHPSLHGAANISTSLLLKRKLPVIKPGARQQRHLIVLVLITAHLSHEVVVGNNAQDD